MSGKSLNMEQLGTLFCFMGASHRLPVPNTVTATSTQPPGSNKKLALLLPGSITTLKLFSKAITLGDACIYCVWLELANGIVGAPR